MEAVQKLVLRARSGDRAAFGELYEQFCSRIHGYITHRLNVPTDAADDLTEEVFLKVLQGLAQFELREVPFTAWLYRVAHNHVVDYVRLQQTRPTVCLEDVSHLLVEEDRAAGWMDMPAISMALERISHKQREVVLMRTLKGLTTAETAAALRTSEEAVRQLHSRGLKALRRLLDSPSQPAFA